ncbi:MAG: AMP-binding protein [Kofleriaceae bacterium]
MSTLNDLLRKLDHRTAGLTFAGAPAVELTYGDLAGLIRGNARHFQDLGVRRGDRVALSIESDLEHVVALLALIAMGAVPVSLKGPRTGDDQYAATLRRLVTRYGVAYAYRTLPDLGVPTLTWAPGATTAADLGLVDVDADDPCIIQFSSGSLGDPKPVPLRHSSLLANMHAITAVDHRHAGAQGWTFLPLSHDMGLIGGLLSNLIHQNPLFLATPQRFLRRPLEFLTWTPSDDCVVAMPDFAVRYLVNHLTNRGARTDARLLARLRHIYCGAEPIRHETIAALVGIAEAWGFEPSSLIPCYGMAEATLIVTSHRFRGLADSFLTAPNGRTIACVGQPIPGTDVVVGQRGPSGEPVASAPGREGVVFVRGPGVCRGYLDAPEFPGGWHDTGDTGLLRDGELYVTGRVKELIIVNGENLFPHDIEQVVLQQEGVRDCMVMSEDDRFFVVVVPTPRATIELSSVAAQIAAQFGAVPAGMALGAAGELERTTSGKPMRATTLAALRPRMAPPAALGAPLQP